MMKQLARGGGIPGMPGMPGMGGGRGKGKQQAPQRKKSKSGNPAKRAAEQRAAAARPSTPGGSFGTPTGTSRLDPSALDPSNLPPGFEKFLGK
jgi:signal recognition particle subunit SRP54